MKYETKVKKFRDAIKAHEPNFNYHHERPQLIRLAMNAAAYADKKFKLNAASFEHSAAWDEALELEGNPYSSCRCDFC